MKIDARLILLFSFLWASCATERTGGSTGTRINDINRNPGLYLGGRTLTVRGTVIALEANYFVIREMENINVVPLPHGGAQSPVHIGDFVEVIGPLELIPRPSHGKIPTWAFLDLPSNRAWARASRGSPAIIASHVIRIW